MTRRDEWAYRWIFWLTLAGFVLAIITAETGPAMVIRRFLVTVFGS
jgi:hypothetical protein